MRRLNGRQPIPLHRHRTTNEDDKKSLSLDNIELLFY
jgi:hypothetical protein